MGSADTKHHIGENQKSLNCVKSKIILHTHTHTHTQIYIYIYRERERERK